MARELNSVIAVIGIDIGKNSFHVVGLDERGPIVLRQKWSRGQVEARFANMPPCLIGMEACSGAPHIGRQLEALGHDVRLIAAQYLKPFLKSHNNDYRDAEAIAEAVQRPTMRFVRIKTPEQMDLLALHRVRSRLVGQRTAVTNQIRGFLIERGITVRQGLMPLRNALPEILSANSGALSPRTAVWKAHRSTIVCQTHPVKHPRRVSRSHGHGAPAWWSSQIWLIVLNRLVWPQTWVGHEENSGDCGAKRSGGGE